MTAGPTLLVVDAAEEGPCESDSADKRGCAPAATPGWRAHLERRPGCACVVAARDYLADPRWRRARRVINLCGGTAYQSAGYYVSLLAQARGQRAWPDIGRLQGLPGAAPRPLTANGAQRPALAILHDPAGSEPPSNAGAIDCFRRAARALGMRAELITAADRGRLADFDALFIRDTTAIGHYTYDFARAAERAGLVVMDDPVSILRCTNKVYLNELFECHGIPTPRSMAVQRHQIERVIPALGLPCILKQPDGAFSRGVVKIESARQLQTQAAAFLADSALILAQEWLPTAFDWRIGVLDRRPLFACKYFMAPGHWQIIKRRRDVKLSEGQAAAVPLARVPAAVLDTALAAARLIGDGFYGVDLKQDGERCCVIEINDNPNVDMGNEDGVLRQALYRRVMQVFRRRIDGGLQGSAPP